MEENIFASFIPISDFNSSDSENLKQYYIDNGITPNNSFMQKYLDMENMETKSPPLILNNNTTTNTQDIGSILGNITYEDPKANTENESNKSFTSETPTKSKKEFLNKYSP